MVGVQFDWDAHIDGEIPGLALHEAKQCANLGKISGVEFSQIGFWAQGLKCYPPIHT